MFGQGAHSLQGHAIDRQTALAHHAAGRALAQPIGEFCHIAQRPQHKIGWAADRNAALCGLLAQGARVMGRHNRQGHRLRL